MVKIIPKGYILAEIQVEGMTPNFPSLTSIAKRRKALGLTQQGLAKLCDIGQSFLAKIERGSAMPSYEIAVKLFTELDRQESHAVNEYGDLKAEEIMVRKVITVTPRDRAENARRIMLERNISQLPVVDARSGAPEGSISEKTLLGKEIAGKTVMELMERDVFPSVARNTKVSVVVSILKEQEQAVLVIEKGKLVGIITKHDLLSKAMR